MLTALCLAVIITTSSALSTDDAVQNDTVHKMAIPNKSGFMLKSGGIKEVKLFGAINDTLKKFNSDFVLPPFKELRLSAEAPAPENIIKHANHTNIQTRQSNQALDDDDDLAYNGIVKIGNQNFVMDFDTGEHPHDSWY